MALNGAAAHAFAHIIYKALLLMSAAQLVDAYRFPQVQGSDRPDFRPADLLDGGPEVPTG